MGKQAEDLASGYLAGQGLRILERNFRVRKAEVDIIASWGSTLVFVEVRSARGSYLDTPAATVDPRKQSKVITAACAYLQRDDRGRLDTRFDVVAVRFTGEGTQIEWIRDAFRPPSTARAGRFR